MTYALKAAEALILNKDGSARTFESKSGALRAAKKIEGAEVIEYDAPAAILDQIIADLKEDFAVQTDDGPVAAEGSEAADDASLKEMFDLAASLEAIDEAFLEALGEGGLNGHCPHCSIDHKANGWQEHTSLIADGLPGLSHEYICLGCNGQWGPKVDQDSFAIRFRAAGGFEPRCLCKALRTVAKDWTKGRAAFLEGAKELGLNTNNAAAEWQTARRR